MIKHRSAFLLYLLLTIGLHGQGNAVDVPNIDSLGDFQAGLWLTDDEGFFERFRESKSPPEFVHVSGIQSKRDVFAFLLLGNAPFDADGRSEVQMKFSIHNPAGDRTFTSEWLSAYRGPALPRNRIHLSADNISLFFSESDSLGDYTIAVEVWDRVSGNSMQLQVVLKHLPPS